jgi:uncharacterized membrane protein YgcG
MGGGLATVMTVSQKQHLQVQCYILWYTVLTIPTLLTLLTILTLHLQRCVWRAAVTTAWAMGITFEELAALHLLPLCERTGGGSGKGSSGKGSGGSGGGGAGGGLGVSVRDASNLYDEAFTVRGNAFQGGQQVL